MRDSYKYFTNLSDYWEIEMAQKLGGSGSFNVCRISLFASKQDGRRGLVALAIVPPDNEKLQTFLNFSNHIFFCPSTHSFINLSIYSNWQVLCTWWPNRSNSLCVTLVSKQQHTQYIQADTFKPFAWALRKKTSIRKFLL